MCAFDKCFIESASLNSAELTENGIKLFQRNIYFSEICHFFNFSDAYAMNLTLNSRGHTAIE